MSEINRMRCVGKIAVVTGTSSGIGQASAKALAEEGAMVYAMDYEVEKAKSSAEEINKTAAGKICDVFYFDATKPENIETTLNEIFEKAGRIDIFVNNAIGGAVTDNLTVTETSRESLNVMMTGIIGVSAELMRVAVPMMIKGGGGSIVNISSIASLDADMSRTYYNVCKAAVNSITQNVALQYGRQGIRCNAVLPGFTVTPAALNYIPKEFVEAWLKHAPIRRLGTPEDQANAVMFFATDDSAWVTGQLLSVCGGFGLGSPMFGDIVEG